MKLYVQAPIYSVDNQELKQPDGTAILLSRVICNVLTAEIPEKISGEEKVKKWLLAQKAVSQEVLELTVEEASLIKKLVNELCPSPIIVAQVYLAIERAGEVSKVEVKSNGVSHALDS